MLNIVFAGTAVTRQGAIGSLYRLDPGQDWQRVADIAEDAGVQAITPHPTRPDVIFLATRKGAFRSTDRGATWQRLAVTEDAVQFWTIVVHPRKPDVVFAAGGPVSFFRSDDGGDTWRKLKADHPERFKITFGHSRVMRIAFHPTSDDVMYAAAEINGFLVSEDGGESWNGIDAGLVELGKLPQLKSRIETDDDTEGVFDAHSVCTSPAAPNEVFYACRMGIFTSSDHGQTWRDLEVSRFAPFAYCRDVRPVCDDPRTLYACFSIASRSNAGAMYRSRDLGDTWARADEAVTAASTIMGFNVHVSDARGVVSVTRGGQVFFTTDGGDTWNERQLPPTAGDAFCGAIL